MASSRLIVVMAGLAFSAATAHNAVAQSKTEIQQMDRNGDGVVTRAEWQGPDGAFRLHDTNKDGVLSGTEVFDARDRGRQAFNDWTPRGFADLDRNRDNRVTSKEWRFDRQSFERADLNRDNVVTRAEFLSVARQSENRGDRFGNQVDRFREFDVNNDGAISRNEWTGNDIGFRALDRNRDNRITRDEYREAVVGTGGITDRFREFDLNNDGAISRTEWRGNDVDFRALDRNRDNFITRDEYREVAATSGSNGVFNQSDAYKANNAYMTGYERGWSEGKAAGREDRDRNQGWDLEGQRELEQADSGYDPRFGSRPQYQEGYRDGFRAAYPEGWERR